VWYPGVGRTVGVTLTGGAPAAADAFVDALRVVVLAEATPGGDASTVWPADAEVVAAATAAAAGAAARAAAWGGSAAAAGGPPRAAAAAAAAAAAVPPRRPPLTCRRLTLSVGCEDVADLVGDVGAALAAAAAAGGGAPPGG